MNNAFLELRYLMYNVIRRCCEFLRHSFLDYLSLTAEQQPEQEKTGIYT